MTDNTEGARRAAAELFGEGFWDDDENAEPKTIASLPKEEKVGETVKGGNRRDPRDNTKLSKVLVPNPNPGGKDVWIDINPNTGGIFLDAGEISILSGMPDPVNQLRAAIKTATASA
jgi:hypothetical protein